MANETGQAHEYYDLEHAERCGHTTPVHGDHVDYFVDGRLHHPRRDH